MPGRILVIGGGIAGLSIAAGLRRAGLEVAVFERAARWSNVQQGSLLNVQVNGMRALRSLGVFEGIRSSVLALEAQEFLSWDGTESLGAWRSAEMAARFDAPDAVVARSALLRALVADVGAAIPCLGAELVSFTQDDTGVTARFADGREERGDALIGADGLRSIVRQQVLGAHEPRVIGTSFTRGFTLSAFPGGPTDRTKLYFAPGAWFGLYPMRRGRVSWFSIGWDDPHSGGEPVAALLERHRGWDPLVAAAIEASDPAAIQTVPMVDHHPVDRWGAGRVTLAGDAAHAMPNTLAQGVAQGLEDAVVLTASLAGTADVERALRAYESVRIPRATEVQVRSQQLGEVFTSEDGLRPFFADAALRETIKRELEEGYVADMSFDPLHGPSLATTAAD